MSLTRREMLGISLAAMLWPLPQPAEARRFVNRTGLRAGRFVWEPSQPDHGPVTVVASLRERLVHVYKSGVLIGIATCQVGRRHRQTPTGIFMTDGQPAHTDDDDRRISWTGMAIHADHVRGYPDSLGCIRVPAAFAQLLNGVIHPGALVILANQRTEPVDVVQSGSLFPILPVHDAGVNPMVQTVAAGSGRRMLPGSPAAGHVAIVISRASRSAVLLRDGVREKVARVAFVQPNSRVGTHVYSLNGEAPTGDSLVWLGFGIGRSGREKHLVSWHGDAVLDQISFEDRASALAITRALHVGATLVVTDEPHSPRKHQAPQDFVLISTLSSKDPGAQPRRRAVWRARRRMRYRSNTWATALVNSWR